MNSSTVRKYFNQLNVEPSPDYLVVEELDLAMRHTAASNPVGDLEADLRAKKVTPKQIQSRLEAAARSLAEKDRMHQVAAQLAGTLDDLYLQALSAGGDDLISKLRPQFDDAVATIVDATDILGSDPNIKLLDTLGTAASVAWEQRKAASRTLGVIHRLRGVLAEAGYGTRAFTPAWYMVDPSPVGLKQATRTFNNGGEGLVNLASHGIELRLNTAGEAANISLRVNEATALAEQQAEEAKVAAARRPTDWKLLAEDARQAAQARAVS